MIVGTLCLLLDHVDPKGSSPYYHPVKWLILLFGSTFAAAAAVAVDNMMRRIRDKRGHNMAQLMNEMIAEHQIAYPTFFVALLTGADFKDGVFWGSPKDILGVLVIIGFVFYAAGVYMTTLHEARFHADHHCIGQPCEKSIGWWMATKIFFPTAALAGTLLVIGIYFAFSTY
jgi:hypothetical protein